MAMSTSFRGVTVLAALVAVLLAVAPVFAAPADYLKHMPSVAQVEQRVRGADADDTDARKVATFRLLDKLIVELSDPSGMGGSLSTEGRALMGQYEAAWNKHNANASLKALQRYPRDDAEFRDEVVALFALAPTIEATRAGFASRAAAEAAAPADPRASSRLGAIGVTALGLLLIAGGIAGMIGIAKENRKIREAEFNRRTSAGAVAFENFNAAEMLRARKKGSDLSGVACIALCMLGMAVGALGALMLT